MAEKKEKAKEENLELSEDEWRCLSRFGTKFVAPCKVGFLEFIESTKNIIEGKPDSDLSKRLVCLSAYISALQQIGNDRVKTYSRVKTFLKPPTDMVCEFQEYKSNKGRFAEASTEGVGAFSQEIPRLKLCLETFLNPFMKFFNEFLNKSKNEDAVEYFNKSFPGLLGKAKLALDKDWKQRSYTLHLDKLPKINDVFGWKNSITESDLQDMKARANNAKAEAEATLEKVRIAATKFNMGFPDVLNSNYIMPFEELSSKLDNI